MGSLLTSWSIYASLACYVGAMWCLLQGNQARSCRVLWTAGAVFLTVHAAAALHFYHGWSHASAVADTAKQTEAILGWPFGQGICFSYLLILLWLGDATRLWLGSTPKLPTSWFIHGYVFFILFNGTVIFEHGWIRWLGLFSTVTIVSVALNRRRRPPSTD